MAIIAIDLGTTNIKVAAFDQYLNLLALESENVKYIRHGPCVEFDAEQYFGLVLSALSRCASSAFKDSSQIRQIVLTGQAESLILTDEQIRPIRLGISWLDERSLEECKELGSIFNQELCQRITGQTVMVPTWPITKILHIKRHEPAVFARTGKFLLLKDYIQFCLTGFLCGEYSIYNFSHYFDITRKDYWTDILAYCGVKKSQLPILIEPCTNIGPVKADIARAAGLSLNTTVNVGTLDHFAGMIGTGNIREGILSESTGTVMTLATFVNMSSLGDVKVPCHYGPFKNSYVLLPVCESGGICLEWFKTNFAAEKSFREIDQTIEQRRIPNDIIFLPYINGVNSPEFDPNACGVFYGLKLKHDVYDLAYAVMEGVAHLLASNIEYLRKIGISADRIISTGGGAKSGLWCQLKADISGSIVAAPDNNEAACLGAAMIGAVDEGLFSSYEDAVRNCVKIRQEYLPAVNDQLANKHALYLNLLKSLSGIWS